MPAQQTDLQHRITHFQKMKAKGRISLLNSVEAQFMAQGGDGSSVGEGEIRKNFYPDWSTKDFQHVCKVMGWEYEKA